MEYEETEFLPDAVGPYVNRAISRDNVGDYEGAIADWTRALELNPGDAGWYVNRGMVRETIGDYDGALADYSRSTELEPNCEVAYIARAHIKGKQGVPRQLYLPVGVNQFCRFTSWAWPRCWAALVR